LSNRLYNRLDNRLYRVNGVYVFTVCLMTMGSGGRELPEGRKGSSMSPTIGSHWASGSKKDESTQSSVELSLVPAYLSQKVVLQSNCRKKIKWTLTQFHLENGWKCVMCLLTLKPLTCT